MDEKRIKLGDFGLSRNNTKMTVASHDKISSIKLKRVLSNLSDTSYESKDNSPYSLEYTGRMGTFLYSSPEQVSGQAYTEKTDLYSLGMILFELMHRPFATNMERIIVMSRARMRSFPEEWKSDESMVDLVDLLSSLLSQRSNDRPSAEKVAETCDLLLMKKSSRKSLITLTRMEDDSSIVCLQIVAENIPGIFDILRGVVDTCKVKTVNFAMHAEEMRVYCEFLLKVQPEALDGASPRDPKLIGEIYDKISQVKGVITVQ